MAFGIKPTHVAGVVLVVALIFVALYAVDYLTETNCFDGQGSAYYIDLSTVQFDGFEAKDLNFDGNVFTWDYNSRRFGFEKIKNPVAAVSWNCPGTKYTYRVSEDGALKVVDAKTFQIYLNAYAQKSPQTLLKLYSSGNSPIFISRPGGKYFVELKR